MTRPPAKHLLGIRFADNDFYNTLHPFMTLVLDSAFVGRPESSERIFENVTKARVVELFNEIAFGLYMLCQNGFRYDDEKGQEHIRNYLKITEKNVYLDDEVTKHIEECDSWDNGEFHYADLSQHKVFTV